MVAGVTRNYSTALDEVRKTIDDRPGHCVIGASIALCRGRTVIVADTAVHGDPRRYPGVDGTVVYEEGLLVGYRHHDAIRFEVAV